MLRDACRTAQKQIAGFDVPTDPAFDRLARLATRILSTPTALVVIADADRLTVIGSAELLEPTDRWATIRHSPLLPVCRCPGRAADRRRCAHPSDAATGVCRRRSGDACIRGRAVDRRRWHCARRVLRCRYGATELDRGRA